MFRGMRRFKQQLSEAECIEVLKSTKRGFISMEQLTRAEKEALIESESDEGIHNPCLRFQK